MFYRYLILSALLMVFAADIGFAGTTGKISGRVTDKETGEALIGVNVIVKGMTIGAVTDLDGYYTILQVPPGVQSVTVSMVGYTPVTVNDIDVHIDQTSELNITLGSETIEMESVTVVAKKDFVRKDLATSVASIQPEEIKTLPVASVNELITLQAGVQENFVVRGGSSDQLLLQVDGVSFRDPRNNQPITSIPLTSIQEVSLERGGFNAEYGQVRSGIVNIVSKEGNADSYFGALQFKISPATPKNFGISVYDPNSMWNRPYLDPAVAWTGTESGAWDTYTQRQYPRFEGWYALSQSLLADDDPSNDLTPEAAQEVWRWERRRRPSIQPDYNIDATVGGPVPFISKALGNLRFTASYRFEKEMLIIPLSRDDYREDNFTVKLNSNITNTMTLMLSAYTGMTRNVAINADDAQFNNPAWGINAVQFWNPTDYMRSPFKIAEITNEQRPSRIFADGWYSEANIDNKIFSGKLTDFIDANTYYEISFENVNRRYFTGPIAYRNMQDLFEIVPGYYVTPAPFGFDSLPNAGITSMFFGGHSSTARDSSRTSSYLLKGDISSQITKEHLLKAGVEFVYNDLNLDYGRVNLYFRDVNYVKEVWRPYRLSVYAQDKIESQGFNVHIGLRMDISNPNTEWVVVDQFDESFFSTSYDPNGSYPKEKAAVEVSFSPRLGISHPITENSKLYFNYGHFKQYPAYEESYRLGRGSAGNIRNYGDPNLKQARTIAYELGYDHYFFDMYQLQIAAFYNDISNQQGYTQILSDRKGIGYFRANNDNYADIRGVELTLKKTQGEWFRGFINYTYQITTSGAFGKARIDEDPSQQIQYDQTTPNLYQLKPVPQPRANVSLTFLTPIDFGPEVAGTKPLGDWALNILGEWRAGEWANYNPNQVSEIGSIVQNVQVTDFSNIDLRLNKDINIDMFTVSLFVEVRNLINSKFLSGGSFYDNHDQRYYLESLHLPESRAYNNIPGEDRIGDYRLNGSPYQPIEQIGNVEGMSPGSALASVIYYDRSTRKYMNVVNGQWAEVDKSRIQKVLDDKAYIDMPNNSSFDFLNPRQVFFGVNLSFKF